MAVNVTYLLGAGASFEALPLVKDVVNNGKVVKSGFANEILSLANRYESLPKNLSNKIEWPINELNKMVSSLRNFGEQCRGFSSPDTFVKSLWLQKNKHNEIELAKKLLSFFLSVSQLADSRLDSRYVPYLASILERQNGVQIPDNINILTWNYDFQLELGLQKFFPQLNLSQIQSHFKSIPGVGSIDKEAKVIHLNGIAGLMIEKSAPVSLFEVEYPKDNLECLREFLRIYEIIERQHKINDNLSFAWELEASERLEISNEIMSKTEILVVIGYSFPFFNRTIDRTLFKHFLSKNTGLSKKLKIYIQDPLIDEDQITFLRQSFEIDDGIEIIPLRNVNQFFLPPEL